MIVYRRAGLTQVFLGGANYHEPAAWQGWNSSPKLALICVLQQPDAFYIAHVPLQAQRDPHIQLPRSVLGVATRILGICLSLLADLDATVKAVLTDPQAFKASPLPLVSEVADWL
ncbi:hypothetical protein SAMN05421881_101619 [Nitrosomonas halophila]|uniref:Uncharacterized protein n=1 Tax=Nitrosomonas halophila TaxID=44576 RepID=A0A1H3GPZ3_9PROT|nr:hypothetical protein SAMN05421881_101619 [Nitrosomonas halophila]